MSRRPRDLHPSPVAGRRAASGPEAGRGFFDPPELLIGARQVRSGAMWAATVCVTGYPREVGPGWLAPLTGHPGLVDVSLHVTPVDPAVSATRLRRRLARLESGRRSGAAHGQLSDPDVEAAADDAQLLADRIARGETRLFETTLTVTVHAATRAELDEELAAVHAVASSLLISARPTTWRALHGWVTGLPVGIDRLDTGRILDTAALAAAFPFTSPDLPATAAPDPLTAARSRPGGVVYGENLGSESLVFWDRWGSDNHNEVVIGTSGVGKSYFVKAELLRQLYTGVHVQVIDPEDEYVRLAGAVGGTVIRAGAPGVRINPLDLPVHHDPATGRRSAVPDALTRQRLFLQTFLTVAFDTDTGGAGDAPGGAAGPGNSPALTALERSVLDTAINTTYRRAGITDDPRTWTRPAPLLCDLRAALGHLAVPPTDTERSAAEPADAEPADAEPTAGPPTNDPTTEPPPGETKPGRDPGPHQAGFGLGGSVAEVAGAAAGLAARLGPFTDGAYAGLFDGPTTTTAAGHLVVWSLRELPEQLRPLGMLLVLDAVWRTVTHPHDRRPRLIVVDEAWLLLARRAAAGFLLRAAKSSRKYWAGLTVVTQDVADMLGSDLGRAVVTNSATAILLRQSAQAVPEVSAVFGLSGGESRFLLSADRGEALLVAGQSRVALAAVVSDTEDALITTSPEFLAAQTAAHGRGAGRDPDWIDLDPPPSPRYPDWSCAPAWSGQVPRW